MRKRALKKRREELRELLADRREALGELVLGMHVQGVWDDGLLARGAAEVREVEDGLAELDTEAGSVAVGEKGVEAEAKRAAGASEQVSAEPAIEQEADEPPKKRRGRLWGRKAEETADEKLAPGQPDAGSGTDTGPHPEFETAEHTAEHLLPPAAGETGPSPLTTAAASPETSGKEAAPPSPTAPRQRQTQPEPEPTGEIASGVAPKEAVESSEEAPAEPVTPKPANTEAKPPTETSGGQSDTQPAVAPSGMPKPSRLDALEQKLEREEREARSAVETARASVGADTGTEVTSLIETLQKDRQSLDQALGEASRRLSEAERKAGQASEKATRLEVENREAAARWVREQAAEIEADATVAAEMTGATGTASVVDEGRVRELENEVSGLRSQVEQERREKTQAIEAAEARLREIETRAAEVESSAAEASNGPDAAELREAAVAWLRGQIVALRREIEAGGGRDGGDS